MGLAGLWRALAPVVADEVVDDVFPRRTLAAVLGGQYVLGGALAVAWADAAALTGAARTSVVTCGALAVVLGATMLVLSRSGMSPRALTGLSHACILSAQAVIAVGHAATGDPAGPLLLLMLWTTPYAGIFSARARWLHVGAGLLALAAATWATAGGDVARQAVHFAIVVATIVVGTLLVSRMTTRLRRSATQDVLTGLPNRRIFFAATRTALARRPAGTGSVLVLLVDVDRFKHVNDTFGHEVGDALLQQVAPRLLAAAGTGGVVARLGGDEFAVLCEDPAEVLDPEQVAGRLVRVWQEPVHVAGRAFHVSGSVGVAVASPEATPRTLLRDADAAMYEAKRSGPGGYRVFHEDLTGRSERLVQVEQGLRGAVRHEQLAVHYQPVVAMTGDAAGRVTGAEALLRWCSPVLGPVGPDEFVPVAESIGLVGELGDWVLERALSDLAGWVRDGLVPGDFQVAVNVSAHQVTLDLPERVAALLDRHGLSARNLGLEVTESAVMRGSTGPEALQRLHALGVTLLLDDFGTGYSSLSQLRELPFDVVKVDRSFVGGMDRRPRDRALVLAVLSLASALGLSVVAEGVEDPAQADVLRAAGCTAAQGYWFSRPVAAEAFPTALQDAAARALAAHPPAPRGRATGLVGAPS